MLNSRKMNPIRPPSASFSSFDFADQVRSAWNNIDVAILSIAQRDVPHRFAESWKLRSETRLATVGQRAGNPCSHQSLPDPPEARCGSVRRRWSAASSITSSPICCVSIRLRKKLLSFFVQEVHVASFSPRLSKTRLWCFFTRSTKRSFER